MHFMYGLANGNAYEARRIYEDRFPNRAIPHSQMFIRLHQRLSENGSFKKLTGNNERPRTVATVEAEEAVLKQIKEDPTTSTRKIAEAVNISQSTVSRILKRELLYPYRLQRVQALLSMVTRKDRRKSSFLGKNTIHR